MHISCENKLLNIEELRMACSKKIDNETASAFPASLGLFSLPPTNVAILGSSYREVLPLNPISDQPYTFRLFNDSQWIDLAQTFLLVDYSITKTEEGVVQVVPYIGQSFIRQLKIQLNNTEIYDSGNLYPFKVYLTNELSFPETVKKTQLRAMGYYANDDQHALLCKKSVQLFSRVDFDLGNQPLLLLNNSELVFKMFRAEDCFLLKGDEAAKFTINNLRLFVKTTEIQPSLNMAIYNRLNNAAVKYAVRKTEMRSLFLTAGRTEFDQVIFTNTIPRRLVIGMVTAKAFNGNFSSSPFEFKTFNIRELSVQAGGQTFPNVPYDLNFTDGQYMRAYMDMFEALGQSYQEGCEITPEEYTTNKALFVISLTPTLQDGPGLELIRNGSTSIRLRFRDPIPAGGVELIVLGEHDQIVSIDKDKRVFTDANLI